MVQKALQNGYTKFTPPQSGAIIVIIFQYILSEVLNVLTSIWNIDSLHYPY